MKTHFQRMNMRTDEYKIVIVIRDKARADADDAMQWKVWWMVTENISQKVRNAVEIYRRIKRTLL